LPQSDKLLAQLLALHPKLIDLSLDRMWRLLSALGHPQDKCPPIIHIAGTNGKGSTAAMLRAMLEADGKKVHAYHSPHLVRFHERIILNGVEIDEEKLAEILARVEAANQGQPITFFEVTTAAAFVAFCETPADYLILEVGLGGRLDATNVVTPRACAITPISLDHQDFLGDTVLPIAEEKAGIMKTGVSCIIAPQENEVAAHLEALAAKRGTPLICAGQDFTHATENERLLIHHETGLLDLPLPNLTGAHQLINAATAVALARELGVSQAAMAKGLETAKWPARLQKLSHGPLVEKAKAALPQATLWLDGGHNEAAAKALAAWAKPQAPRPLHIILALLNTKAQDAYMAALAETGAQIYCVPIEDNPNTIAPDELAATARAHGLHASAHATIEKALEPISTPNALILIAGSLYLAGAVLRDNG
jgi:dihydrofolate synthase/folylpolyglutamate synthase